MTLVGSSDVYSAQELSVGACIWAGIGFALLGPALLGGAVRLLVPLAAGVSSELSLAAVRQRLQQAATPMMPIIASPAPARAPCTCRRSPTTCGRPLGSTTRAWRP